MSNDFVHLHLHSDYSMLDGACQVKRLCKKVKELGQDAVAVTDHGNMFATLDLYWAAKDAGIKPIIGCEFYIAPAGIDQKKTPRHHLVLLAKNYEGYKTMCHLNEIAWSDEGFYYKPRIDRDALRKWNKDVIALSACIGGEVPKNLLQGDEEKAREAIEFYIEMFGRENFFLEMQFHAAAGTDPKTVTDPEVKELLELESRANKRMAELAKEYGIGIVATNDAHYLNQEDAKAHDALLCIGTQSQINDTKRFKFSGDQFYVKSSEQMKEIFKDYPEAIANTVKIAEQCNCEIPLGVNHYPVYRLDYAQQMADDGFAPVLPEVKDDVDDAHCPIRRQYLWEICARGLKERYNLLEPGNPDYVPKGEDEPDPAFRKEILDRMEFELGIIDKMGFISYFLVVWDFINYAQSIDIPVGPGRGSGAGSLVAYLTGITNLDPLRYGLLFERFLNPDRVSPPDFDIDFCERRRWEVIEYVRNKYGSPSVAQIGTFGTLKAKAVLKDVARVMGIPFADANRVVGAIPTDPKMTLEKALQINEVKELYDSQQWVQEMFNLGGVLEGLNRNQSIHACGVIIGDQPLANLVPLARGAGKEWITQFPAYPCEALGLLKMDFLGLKTLTVIQDTLDLVNTKTGGNFVPDDIPISDQNTFDLLNRGETIAVFQLESGGMQDLCRRFGISKIEEIIALVALYRPGPMEFIPTFINCKLGKEIPEYETQEMEELLSETYGIMVYQEQIMQVVQAVAGFSLAQADIMRRAIGKKKESVLIEQGELFKKGCLDMGHTEAIAESIWAKILKFAAYGFNKSHSACYGLMSYRTAYLKANHPAEFMAAVLNCEINDASKLSFYIAECKAMGLQILPPDVNTSKQNFTVDNGDLRFGIAGLKGVGASAADAIINAQKDGTFKSLIDFCERTGSKVNKRVMESLCKAGAFDSFGLHRSQILEMIEQALSQAAGTVKDREMGQGSLFDLFDDSEKDALADASLNIPDIPEWDEHTLLGFEKELLGFYVSGHPLGEKADLIRKYASSSIAVIKEHGEDNQGVLIGGMITTLAIKQTKATGDSMAIFTIEDTESNIECLLFPKSYKEWGSYLQSDGIVFLEAFVSAREDEQVKLIINKVTPIEQLCANYTNEVHIRLHESSFSPDHLEDLRQVCLAHKGEVPVIFCITCANGDIGFIRPSAHFKVDMSEEFMSKVRDLAGDQCIHLKPRREVPVKERKRWQQRAS